MPDEAPEHTAGWTLQTQHIYTHRVIADLEKRVGISIECVESRFEQRVEDLKVLHAAQLSAANKALEAARLSSDKAIDKSAVDIERWREAMNDREKNFATKSDVEAVEKQLYALSSRMDKTEGKGLGATGLLSIAVSVAAVLGALIAIFRK